MKVIWGKFGTGVDLILCVIINYYVVSIWVNGKDEFPCIFIKNKYYISNRGNARFKYGENRPV